jgi:protein TonB
MFTTLESTWDRSARRGWTTLASFGFQAMALSLLLAVPLIWVQGPPTLAFIEHWTLAVPQGPPPPTPQQPHQQQAPSPSNYVGKQLLQPRYIPVTTPEIRDAGLITPPAFPDGVPGGNRPGAKDGIPGGLGDPIPAVIPKAPVASIRPIPVSHWSEGNLIYRVQPVYPALARQARIQGPVELRAIISKTGTIENLTVVGGHPMLVTAAVDAVKHWRYRPYLLNDEPYAIETEITVNFILAGN